MSDFDQASNAQIVRTTRYNQDIFQGTVVNDNGDGSYDLVRSANTGQMKRVYMPNAPASSLTEGQAVMVGNFEGQRQAPQIIQGAGEQTTASPLTTTINPIAIPGNWLGGVSAGLFNSSNNMFANLQHSGVCVVSQQRPIFQKVGSIGLFGAGIFSAYPNAVEAATSPGGIPNKLFAHTSTGFYAQLDAIFQNSEIDWVVNEPPSLFFGYDATGIYQLYVSNSNPYLTIYKYTLTGQVAWSATISSSYWASSFVPSTLTYCLTGTTLTILFASGSLYSGPYVLAQINTSSGAISISTVSGTSLLTVFAIGRNASTCWLYGYRSGDHIYSCVANSGGATTSQLLACPASTVSFVSGIENLTNQNVAYSQATTGGGEVQAYSINGGNSITQTYGPSTNNPITGSSFSSWPPDASQCGANYMLVLGGFGGTDAYAVNLSGVGYQWKRSSFVSGTPAVFWVVPGLIGVGMSGQLLVLSDANGATVRTLPASGAPLFGGSILTDQGMVLVCNSNNIDIYQ